VEKFPAFGGKNSNRRKWVTLKGGANMNMEVNALQQMLSRLRQVQEDLQQQVNSVAVEASAGGGMVTVKMNGQKQIVDLRIEKDIFASKDHEMLQDLVRAAVNEASRRVDEELANQMKSLAGGMPGMAGLKIPGLF
jgi:nucleoid-associated protein EbfC